MNIAHHNMLNNNINQKNMPMTENRKFIYICDINNKIKIIFYLKEDYKIKTRKILLLIYSN